MNIYTKRALEAIDQLLEKKRVKSDRQLALSIKMTPSQLSEARKNKREFPDKYFDHLQSVHNVNKEYILTGEGDMLLNPNDLFNINTIRCNDAALNMMLVPLKAYGGFLSGYENNVYKNQLERIAFPMVKGECYAFEVGGFSMIKKYNPGDYFVGTPVESFKDLVKDRDYVFQTIDGLILKTFEKIENDCAHLYSLNDEYNPVKPIYLKEIKVIYHKEAVIKF